MPHSRRSNKPAPAQTLRISLDPRLELEAWLLRTLERAPAERRQEWLRGLLVSGFLQYRSQARRVQGRDRPGDGLDARPAPARHHRPTAFADYLTAGRAPAPPSPPTQKPSRQTTLPEAVEEGGKPFARLREVIGQ